MGLKHFYFDVVKYHYNDDATKCSAGWNFKFFESFFFFALLNAKLYTQIGGRKYMFFCLFCLVWINFKINLILWTGIYKMFASSDSRKFTVNAIQKQLINLKLHFSWINFRELIEKSRKRRNSTTSKFTHVRE